MNAAENARTIVKKDGEQTLETGAVGVNALKI
jgi:hypothetical protein